LEVSISPFRVWSYLRYLWLRRHRSATLFPYTTLFRSIWFCCILSPEQNIFSMTLFIQSIILMLAIALISQCQDRSGAGGHADTVHWENISLEPDEYFFFVNSYRVECTGVGPRTCWQVKKGKDARIENKPWTLLYEPISGLDWEPGYRYTLIVRE